MLDEKSYLDDIIGKPPSSFVHYGMSFIAVFILIVLFFAWKVDYSDSIHSEISLNSKQPTINVLSEQQGVINKLFVRDDELVKAGDSILLYQSDIEFETFSTLKSQLDNSSISQEQLLQLNTLELGGLRPAFQKLFNLIVQRNKIDSSEHFHLSIEKSQIKKKSLKSQLDELNKQLSLYKQKSHLSLQNYDRGKFLYAKQQVSKRDLEKLQAKLLDGKVEINNIEIVINNLNSELILNNKNIDLSETEKKENLLELEFQIGSQKQLLIDQLKQWEKINIITAPISGKLSIPNHLYTYQSIKLNEELFSISPFSSNLIGRVKLPEFGAGKVSIGQTVEIKLNSFPYQEFGKINGTVIKKSSSVHDNSYSLDIKINEYNASTLEMITSYQKNIQYNPNMKGEVEIITSKKTILNRLLESIISAL